MIDENFPLSRQKPRLDNLLLILLESKIEGIRYAAKMIAEERKN